MTDRVFIMRHGDYDSMTGTLRSGALEALEHSIEGIRTDLNGEIPYIRSTDVKRGVHTAEVIRERLDVDLARVAIDARLGLFYKTGIENTPKDRFAQYRTGLFAALSEAPRPTIFVTHEPFMQAIFEAEAAAETYALLKEPEKMKFACAEYMLVENATVLCDRIQRAR